MMNIGIHPRISGHPARFVGLKKFVEYVMSEEFRDKIWICTRSEIAEFWMKHYPPKYQESKPAKL